eukprot:gb/GECG01011395.1/.p1 GENE.gb/GECG01011395.1/~~gb/GECG01011395.1/.p1  ORF type:complete len:1684 (+),score=158.38 gb/GECG01011395.1/:1-5052(+)
MYRGKRGGRGRGSSFPSRKPPFRGRIQRPYRGTVRGGRGYRGRGGRGGLHRRQDRDMEERRRARETLRKLQEAIKTQFSTTLQHKLRHFSLVRQRDSIETNLKVSRNHRRLCQHQADRIQRVIESLRIWQRALHDYRVMLYGQLLHRAMHDLIRMDGTSEVKSYMLMNLVVMTILGLLARSQRRKNLADLKQETQDLLVAWLSHYFIRPQSAQDRDEEKSMAGSIGNDSDPTAMIRTCIDVCIDCAIGTSYLMIRTVGETIFLLMPLENYFVRLSQHFLDFLRSRYARMDPPFSDNSSGASPRPVWLGKRSRGGDTILWTVENRDRFHLLELVNYHARYPCPSSLRFYNNELSFYHAFVTPKAPQQHYFQVLLRERHGHTGDKKPGMEVRNTEELFDPFADFPQAEMDDDEGAESDFSDNVSDCEIPRPFESDESPLNALTTYYFHPAYAASHQSTTEKMGHQALQVFIERTKGFASKLERVIERLELPVVDLLERVTGAAASSSHDTTDDSIVASGGYALDEEMGAGRTQRWCVNSESGEDTGVRNRGTNKPVEQIEHEQAELRVAVPGEDGKESDDSMRVNSLPELIAFLTELERQVLYGSLQDSSDDVAHKSELLDFLLRLAAVRCILEQDPEKADEILALNVSDSEGERAYESLYSSSSRFSSELTSQTDNHGSSFGTIICRLLTMLISRGYHSLELSTTECKTIADVLPSPPHFSHSAAAFALSALKRGRFESTFSNERGSPCDGAVPGGLEFGCYTLQPRGSLGSELEDNQKPAPTGDSNGEFLPLESITSEDASPHQGVQLSSPVGKKLFDREAKKELHGSRYAQSTIEDILQSSGCDENRGRWTAGWNLCDSTTRQDGNLSEDDTMWMVLSVLRGGTFFSCKDPIHRDAHHYVRKLLSPWSENDPSYYHQENSSHSFRCVAHEDLRRIMEATPDSARREDFPPVRQSVQYLRQRIKKDGSCSPLVRRMLLSLCAGYGAFFEVSDYRQIRQTLVEKPEPNSCFHAWVTYLDARILWSTEISTTAESVMLEYIYSVRESLSEWKVAWRVSHFLSLLLRLIGESYGAFHCMRKLSSYGWGSRNSRSISLNLMEELHSAAAAHFWLWVLYLRAFSCCPPQQVTKRPGTLWLSPPILEEQSVDSLSWGGLACFGDVLHNKSNDGSATLPSVVFKSAYGLSSAFTVMCEKLQSVLDKAEDFDKNTAALLCAAIKYSETCSATHSELAKHANAALLLLEHPDELPTLSSLGSVATVSIFQELSNMTAYLVGYTETANSGSTLLSNTLASASFVLWYINDCVKGGKEREALVVACCHFLQKETLTHSFDHPHILFDSVHAGDEVKAYLGKPLNPETVERLAEDVVHSWCDIDGAALEPPIHGRSVLVALWVLFTLNGRSGLIGRLKKCLRATTVWLSRVAAEGFSGNGYEDVSGSLLHCLGSMHCLSLYQAKQSKSLVHEKHLLREGIDSLTRWSTAVQSVTEMEDSRAASMLNRRGLQWLCMKAPSCSLKVHLGSDDVYGGWCGLSPPIAEALTTMMLSSEKVKECWGENSSLNQSQYFDLPFRWNDLLYEQQVRIAEAPRQLLDSTGRLALNAWLVRDHDFLHKHGIHTLPERYEPTPFTELPALYCLRDPLSFECISRFQVGGLASFVSSLKPGKFATVALIYRSTTVFLISNSSYRSTL